jgi:hypothetical protein
VPCFPEIFPLMVRVSLQAVSVAVRINGKRLEGDLMVDIFFHYDTPLHRGDLIRSGYPEELSLLVFRAPRVTETGEYYRGRQLPWPALSNQWLSRRKTEEKK